MRAPRPLVAPLVIGGWSIFAHPLFVSQVEDLIAEVEAHRAKDPVGYVKKNSTKRLAAIYKLVTQAIPADPASPVFRQGDTLGASRKHWLRAKFFQQYRLFFRYDGNAKFIVLAWVNDDETLRAYGAKTDAYKVFRDMLADGHPPDTLDALLKEAAAASDRFEAAMQRADNP